MNENVLRAVVGAPQSPYLSDWVQVGDWIQGAQYANTPEGHCLVLAIGEKAFFARRESDGDENAYLLVEPGRPAQWVKARRFQERWFLVYKEGHMRQASVSHYTHFEHFVSALQEVQDDGIVDYTVHVLANGHHEFERR